MRAYFPPLGSIPVGALSLLLIVPTARSQFVVHPIAINGDPAPDRTDAFFDSFNGLSLNDGGDVAVVAQTGFNVGGIWKTTAGVLGLVADSSFNEAIHLAADGRLIHANSARIVIYDGASAVTIAEAGQLAPTRPDLTVTTLGAMTPAAGDQFLFTAIVRATTQPFDALGPSSLWLVDGSVVRLIALGRTPVPAVGPDYIFENRGSQAFPPGTHAVADNGDVFFVALFNLPGPDPTRPLETGVGLFVDRGGVIELLYRDGDPAPGLTDGESFEAFQNVRSLDDGSVTFRAILDGPGVDETNRAAWFVESDGGLELLLRTGETVPGLPAGSVYRALRDVHATPDALAFISVTNEFADPQLGAQRIWNGPPDDLAEIVAADWLADPPGSEGDTATVIRLTGNASGRFIYQTADVIGDELPEVLHMGGQNVDRRIVGVGDEIEGRTVSALLQHAINEAAEVAVHVRFDDDGEGILLFAMLGDFDRDADVDMTDFIDFAVCYAGMNVGPGPGCPPDVNADFDGDGDVDLSDYARFAQSFTGSL